MSCQSRFYAGYWMLGAGALGQPRGMVRGGRREEGSGWGTRVYLWQVHVDIWQNQYNIVKLKNKKKTKTKASILQHSAFFIVQLSHPYMTTGKTIALTRWTYVGKVMSLLFNMLSRLVITFFSKEQVSFNFMAAVTICSDFGAPKNSLTLFPLFPHLCAMK